ncbi:SWIM zinc finger family protein [Kitasatospora sp. NBC_01250]|uniref:SWIM zinc finger family protein n=1 Tax=Kitasatospora sp. NBC_01250 TaxID=2903571 RepID=UPI002E31A97F|nr:SWIM zinc finger family protein [Kitasatospora sp. NBC_01250]
MEERWSTEHVLSLASDAAARAAGGRLSSPAAWSRTGCGQGALWGLCQGSGSAPYRTVVEFSTPAYQCSCPSRTLPCKHALGLLLLWSGDRAAVPAGAEPADWAARWLAGRRRRAEPTAAPADPVAARRRADRRAARVAAGAAELRLRLADRVRRGLADPGAAAGGWAEVAARMVDAQAPGLASCAAELDRLPADGQLAGHALLYLLATACERIGELPEPLAHTVRARVGFTVDSAELLAGPTVRDHWLVLGSRDSTDGPLTTRRLWLRGAKTGRSALLLSYGRPGQAPEPTLPTGWLLEAELAFHPGARPLRAVLGPRHGAPGPTPGAPPAEPVSAALAHYGEAVAADPWTESWPVVLRDVRPIATADGWQLTDHQHALPLHATPEQALWRLAAVSGGRPVTVFGECDHRGFTPVTVWDEQGRTTGLTTGGAA